MMGMFSFLLVIAVAANAAGTIIVAPSINEQVDSVFQDGLCQELGCGSRIEKVKGFHIWVRTWWFWPVFYGGHISGLRGGFHRVGDCVYKPDDKNVAKCDVGFSGLGIHYSWWVGVKNSSLKAYQQLLNPPQRIEAGTVNATVAKGTTAFCLERDLRDGYFRVTRIHLGMIDIEDMVFTNSTVTWHDKRVDTKERLFQRKVRDMFAYWVEYYLHYMTFLEGFNAAFVKAQQ